MSGFTMPQKRNCSCPGMSPKPSCLRHEKHEEIRWSYAGHRECMCACARTWVCLSVRVCVCVCVFRFYADSTVSLRWPLILTVFLGVTCGNSPTATFDWLPPNLNDVAKNFLATKNVSRSGVVPTTFSLEVLCSCLWINGRISPNKYV